MGKRVYIAVAFGSVVLFAAVYWAVVSSSIRELGRRTNEDGTQTVAVGKPRVFGLLGIEVVYVIENSQGVTLRNFGVRDQCGSWSEAQRKHSASNMQAVWEEER